MDLDTITKGEELLKKVNPGKWEIVEDTANGKEEMYCHWHGVGPMELPGKEADDVDLLVQWLVNHASELLQCAREVEEMKVRIHSLENPLPTQEEEREFYHRVYHICHTGCPMPCPSKVLYVDPKRLEAIEEREWPELLGAVARGWCHDANANKVMDEELATAIAREVMPLVAEAERRGERKAWSEAITLLNMAYIADGALSGRDQRCRGLMSLLRDKIDAKLNALK